LLFTHSHTTLWGGKIGKPGARERLGDAKRRTQEKFFIPKILVNWVGPVIIIKHIGGIQFIPVNLSCSKKNIDLLNV
jgi:hypothetical protein